MVVSGEKEMIGASMLSAEAALRANVGSVKALCSKENFKIFASNFPSLLKKEINSFNEFKKVRFTKQKFCLFNWPRSWCNICYIKKNNLSF